MYMSVCVFGGDEQWAGPVGGEGVNRSERLEKCNRPAKLDTHFPQVSLCFHQLPLLSNHLKALAPQTTNTIKDINTTEASLIIPILTVTILDLESIKIPAA